MITNMKLTADFVPMNGFVLLRGPKKTKRPVQLTDEQELELVSKLYFEVMAVSEEASKRVEVGDGVYFAEDISEHHIVPVKAIETVEVEKEIEVIDPKQIAIDGKTTKKVIKTGETEELEHTLIVMHIARLVGCIKGMYK